MSTCQHRDDLSGGNQTDLLQCYFLSMRFFSSTSTSFKMAEFDLTTRMGQYLDRHLVFPLLEFLSVKEVMYHCVFISYPFCYDRPSKTEFL